MSQMFFVTFYCIRCYFSLYVADTNAIAFVVYRDMFDFCNSLFFKVLIISYATDFKIGASIPFAPFALLYSTSKIPALVPYLISNNYCQTRRPIPTCQAHSTRQPSHSMPIRANINIKVAIILLSS